MITIRQHSVKLDYPSPVSFAIYEDAGLIGYLRFVSERYEGLVPVFAAAPELLKALKGLANRSSACKCQADELNPCWDNRPNDRAGLHWGSETDNLIPACALCNARAAIAKAEGSII